MFRNPLIAFSLLCLSSFVQADVTVVSSVRPLQFIAAAIVGDRGTASALIGTSDSPHSFALTPQDRLAIAQSDVLLWIAPEFEIYLSDLFVDQAEEKSVITVRDLPAVTALTFEDGIFDPHVWLDPDNGILIATALTETLSAQIPQQAGEFRVALARFTEAVDDTREQIQRDLQRSEPASYMVYHEAYQYFETEFGLVAGGALVHNPELEPGMREVIALRQQVEEVSPKCIILEPDASLALVDTLVQDPDIARISIDLLGYDIEVSSNAYEELLIRVADGFQSCFNAGN